MDARQTLLPQQVPTIVATKAISPSQPNLPTPDANANMAHYRHLIERVIDVFGDEIKASRWLSHPSPDFSGATPLQIAQLDDYRIDRLEPILNQIEHGIYA